MSERVAWVFPGQGAQEPGMGRDAFEASAAARSLFERADRVLDRPLSRLCFEGPDDELRRTANAQPAIFVASLAYFEAARERGAVATEPAYAAGHSLGEYTALVAAGALDFEAALLLVAERGRLMEEAGRINPGTMAAIMALDADAVRALCRDSGAELCNLNSAGQSVIGGTAAAVERAMTLAKERGGKAVALNVGGAFHTSLMQPAADGMQAAVARAPVRDPRVPVVGNWTAQPLTSAAEIRRELVAQLTSPVLWQASVEFMATAGVSTFIEFGPGRVLTGLIKRIAPAARLLNVNSAAALSTAVGGERV